MTGCVSANGYRIGGITASTERTCGITAFAERECGITAFASLVCDIDKGRHLRVMPTETQWVDVGVYQDYRIETNREWEIE